jgi:hypothetical protein
LTLEELDVEFVIRVPQTGKVQRFIADHNEDTFVADYEMARSNPPTGRTTVRRVVVPHRSCEDDHSCLVTNRDATRHVAQPLAEAYRRRWVIETSYRKVTEFLPKTSFPTFSLRLFYFLFAVALYNLWVLTNLLLTPDRAVRLQSAADSGVTVRVSTPRGTGKTARTSLVNGSWPADSDRLLHSEELTLSSAENRALLRQLSRSNQQLLFKGRTRSMTFNVGIFHGVTAV